MWRSSGKVQIYSNGVSNDVCGMRRVGGQGRKRSEWLDEEVCMAVAEKRRAFEEWPQREVIPGTS